MHAPLNLSGYWLALPVIRCIAEFTLGIVAFRCAATPAGLRIARSAWIAPALCLVVAVFLAFPMSDLAVVLVFPLLVVSLTSESHLPGRILASPPAEFIGRLSYSIHLAQPDVPRLAHWRAVRLSEVPAHWGFRRPRRGRISPSESEASQLMVKLGRLFRRSPFRSFLLGLVLAASCAGCGGGGGGGGSALPATVTAASRTVSAAAVKHATVRTTAFNNWPTYAYDNSHDGYNPNSTLFTDASIAKLHLGWDFALGEAGAQTQPILATNIGTHQGVLYVGGRKGIEYAIDALTGAPVWSKSFGTMQMKCVGANGQLLTLGIQGTSVYQETKNALFVVDSVNSAPNGPQTITLYKLDPLTGATLGSVNVTPTNLPGEVDFAHTGLTLASGTLYLGTGSTCDISSWRGRLAAVDVGSMTLADTFFPVYNQGGAYSGGGVWGWGGAAVDKSANVYVGVGNADFNSGSIGPKAPFIRTTSEQVGYAEHVLSLSSNLKTVNSSYAVPYKFSKTAQDLDLSGTPVLYTPVGCPQLLAIQGKAGLLNIYNSANIGGGPIGSYTFSEMVGDVSYIGNGTYSPLTGLYYANVPTSQGGSIEPPGMVAIGASNCSTPSITWAAQFGADSYNIGSDDGAPRSAPTVTAGGVVFVASPLSSGQSQLWALDATTGAVLHNGKPIYTTANLVRMPPVVDGEWMYVLDQGGHLYAFTLDSDFAAKPDTMKQTADPMPAW